jgi:hypothetical protein
LSFTQSSVVPETIDHEETILEWRIHLAAQKPLRAALIVSTLSLALIFGLLFVKIPLLVLITCFALFSSVAEFLLPIHYRLTTHGAYSRSLFNLSFIEWKRVKKVYMGTDGIKLSPLARRTRLENFRGVKLRVTENNRDQVLQEIQKWRDANRKN